MSETQPEFFWVRYRREAAIRVPIGEVDTYLSQGYVVIPIRDEPTAEES